MADIKRYFKQGEIEKIAKIIGETDNGLKGSEIGHLLLSTNIKDTDPKLTKWQRLYNALAEAYNERGTGNHILAFIAKAFEPARWAGEKERYLNLIEQLNTVLAFHGLEFRNLTSPQSDLILPSDINEVVEKLTIAIV